MDELSYVIVSSAFGNVSIVWREAETGPRVYRVLLPNEQVLIQDSAQVTLFDTGSSLPPAIAGLAERLHRYLTGDALEFEQRHLDLLAFETCSEFQRRVLIAEYRVPRGQVSTYGRVAKHLGVPGGARAVGNALGRNPFPIVIPCHRTIRADGGLGGYRGGVDMKRALLEMEGVPISPAGKVSTDLFFY